jgi:hypothetical protein
MKTENKVVVNPKLTPKITYNTPLTLKDKTLWQVICGDGANWRAGLYSPDIASVKEIKKLEKHSCPEFFMLVSGKISLLIESDIKPEAGIKVIELEAFKPILVNTWHNGFCPDGPYTGSALVVELGEFTTEYKYLTGPLFI